MRPTSVTIKATTSVDVYVVNNISGSLSKAFQSRHVFTLPATDAEPTLVSGSLVVFISGLLAQPMVIYPGKRSDRLLQSPLLYHMVLMSQTATKYLASKVTFRYVWISLLVNRRIN